VCGAVLLADENDQRPYDPFGDDDITTLSAPVVSTTTTVTAAMSVPASARNKISLVSICYFFQLYHFSTGWPHFFDSL